MLRTLYRRHTTIPTHAHVAALFFYEDRRRWFFKKTSTFISRACTRLEWPTRELQVALAIIIIVASAVLVIFSRWALHGVLGVIAKQYKHGIAAALVLFKRSGAVFRGDPRVRFWTWIVKGVAGRAGCQKYLLAAYTKSTAAPVAFWTQLRWEHMVSGCSPFPMNRQSSQKSSQPFVTASCAGILP